MSQGEGGGCPTKYSEDMQKLADNYAEEGWRDEGHLFPSNVGLALTLKVAEKTIDNWLNSTGKPKFLQTLGKIKAKQHLTLLENGLTNQYNSTITKLALHNHGYSDKSSQELTGAQGGPIGIAELPPGTIGNEADTLKLLVQDLESQGIPMKKYIDS